MDITHRRGFTAGVVIGEQVRTSYTGVQGRSGHRGAGTDSTHRRGSRAGEVMGGAGKGRGGEQRAVAGNSLTKGETLPSTED